MNGKKLIIPALFALFLVTTCHEPLLPSEPGYWDKKPQGTPLYVYLDNDYNVEQSGTDTGRTAVFVDENPLAEGILIIAEQSAMGYDDAVHLINRNTDTVISVFFHKDQRFPWLISIDTPNGTASARLLGYEWSDARFSLEFEENGISIVAKNIWLSQNTLLIHRQDLRLRNIYAALAVYESISRAFPDNGKVFLNAGNTGGTLASAFTDISLAAFATSVKPARSIISAREYMSGESPAYFFDKIVDWFIGLFGGGSSSPSAPPPAPPPLSVTITTNGVPVDPETIYYLEKGEEIAFDFAFTNLTENTNVTAALYEPTMHLYINWNGPSWNNHFFSFTQPDGSPLGRLSENYSIKIKRNWLEGSGYHNGTAALVVFFGENTIINSNNAGIVFWEPGSSMSALNCSVFVIQLTVNQTVAKP